MGQMGRERMRCPDILHDIAEEQREPGETKGEALTRYIQDLRGGEGLERFKSRFKGLTDQEQLEFIQALMNAKSGMAGDKDQQVTA